MPSENNDDIDFSERQPLYEGKPQSRQCTVAGIVSTKQRRLEDNVMEEVPMSYSTNSNKELLCLEYVANFRKQFDDLMDASDIRRPPLYLCPPNERGIPKFVCTTLRPTLLPFLDLYDMDKLATFVSGLIEYEPLVDPCAPPACLPSPSAVLAWQAGDSFDMANLLASFLIGAGYDAYVVHGRAPKWVCLLDQSQTECPYLAETAPTASGTTTTPPAATDATAAPKDEGKSKFVAMQEAKEAARRAEEAARLDWTKHMDVEDDDEDELNGKRVHAWVLVRAGRRDVTEHVYLEPSTGRKYSVRESPYVRIEAVWNHQNYWVNMQVSRGKDASATCANTLFDLSHATDWEFVFLSAHDRRGATNGGGGLHGDGGGGESKHDDLDGSRSDNNSHHHHHTHDSHDDNDPDNAADDNVLDLPPSWVTKLHVERKAYKRRFVTDGQRTTLFRKAKVEEFAENSHNQGLVLRITQFRNVARTLPVQVREVFKNRKDKLHLRIRYPLEGKFDEHFLPGRVPEALAKRTEWSGVRRDLGFYTSARMDGLVTREEVIHKRIVEVFQGRDDFLVGRSVALSEDKEEVKNGAATFVLPGGATGELTVLKMAEKFDRNERKDADEDARKRTYNVRDGSIHVQFHYAEGKITSGARIYHKAPGTPVEVLQVDPMATRPKESILERELQASIQMEKECYNSIRHADVETQEILKFRRREEATIVLETSIFDSHDDETKQDRVDDQRKAGKDAKADMDYLSPFLLSVAGHGGGGASAGRQLSRDEAHSVRDLCLKNLKERLLERANIIQTRLDKENAALAKKQAAFQRSQREHDQGTDEEFERFCSETMFRIQILEQRLTRHEETALQKYAELDQRLHNDARLAVLHQ
ncbi:hypothetical protein, variant [Aphanomyces invadans]|uniref:Dynein regulatory complex subunit 7 n=1 Tax=Aphanomyces invadans TaxID=157072 RepID=A0A024TYJ8_9STRA|nr:hypothetical protein, variant [Aphanomyces invadans]ETV99093.1 hypothetical protein, variant [Aphanomyces invadans]|eukprot:XP_008872520.1 hypothetical protein, variant [Aphanomyces invadans]